MSTDLVDSLLSSLSLTGEDADGLMPHCPYDFIIAVDLEATCDENHSEPAKVLVPRDKGEIIELSYAVVSVPERRIVHQRQNYVRPVETVVTPFCTQLTGITPEMVADAGTLRDAVEDLLSFIQANPQSTFCFMAHTEWDFRFQLPRECQEKGIQLPPLFSIFFDVTKEVHRMQSLASGAIRTGAPNSLLSLCKAMGLQPEGRLHCGLNDAVTVARLAIVLFERVHTWFAEKRGVDDALAKGLELPLSCPVDLGQEIEEFAVERSRVLRLGGVPFKATQSQVAAFFGQAGTTPESTWVIKNAEGRSDGRGLVVMLSHEDAMAGLSLNGRIMGDRVVHVTPGHEVDLEDSVAVRAPFLTDAQAQHATPTQEVKPGDWLCATCQFHNFASRRSCSKCHAANPSPTPYVSNQPLKAGDWICQDPTCMFQNFASRVLCMRCRGPRPHGMKPSSRNGLQYNGQDSIQQQRPQEVRAGDWFCPNCQFHNFGQRRNCVKCSFSVNISQAAGPSRPYAPAKAGDWTCPNPQCGFHNFANRVECKICQAGKPEKLEEYHQQQHHEQHHQQQHQHDAGSSHRQLHHHQQRQLEMRPGDWLCPTCSAHNFASRRTCIKCNNAGGGGEPSHHNDARHHSNHHRHHHQPHNNHRAPHHPHPKNALRPGDWLCPDPQCAFWNFKSKTVCTRCEQAPAYGTAQVVPRREGDWDCPDPQCGFNNYASRTECHRCGTSKPELEEEQ
ncbi:hypothetical protein PhCBS80983_g04487 [Powellomyces hirtus]|uniref:Uncharacterized protein n=1 Tax=Powellomyces hirtus TaxID=109895 RepID=A0A507DZH0_9FUNG|nr:hypothetical protein PhCBS80983_g04487 [Powellomyces hirtus]